MIRSLVVTALASVMTAFSAFPGDSFGGDKVAAVLADVEQAKPSVGITPENRAKINEAESKLIENLMRRQIARQLLVTPEWETFLPVPENWKKHIDSTGARSYFVPLIETDETIAYQALIDSLKKISPAHSKPKLLTLSKE
ncbi:MAG: hypothetical protein ACPGFB_15570 [Verrucomicrobiales bacterium]